MKLASHQYRAWSDCTDVHAGLTLYRWQRLTTFSSSRIRVNILLLSRGFCYISIVSSSNDIDTAPHHGSCVTVWWKLWLICTFSLPKAFLLAISMKSLLYQVSRVAIFLIYLLWNWDNQFWIIMRWPKLHYRPSSHFLLKDTPVCFLSGTNMRF